MNWIFKKAEQFLKKNKNIKRWKKVVFFFAVITVFITTYALILPAITVEESKTEEVGIILDASEETAALDEVSLEEPEEIPAEETVIEEPVEEIVYSEPEELVQDQGAAEETPEPENTPDFSSEAESGTYEERSDAGEDWILDAPESDASDTGVSSDFDETVQPENEADETKTDRAQSPLVYESEDYIVYVSFEDEAEIPAGTELTVRTPDDFSSYRELAEARFMEEKDIDNISLMEFYEFCFTADGNRIIPADDTDIRIVYKHNTVRHTDETVLGIVIDNYQNVSFPEKNADQSDVVALADDMIAQLEIKDYRFTDHPGVIGVAAGMNTKEPLSQEIQENAEELLTEEDFGAETDEQQAEELETEELETEELEAVGTAVTEDRKYTASADGYFVEVTAPADAFEEEVTLTLESIGVGNLSEPAVQLLSENGILDGVLLLDICFVNDAGEEVEPQTKVSVNMTIDRGVLPQGDALAVYHIINENGERSLEKVADIEDISPDASDNTVTAMSDSEGVEEKNEIIEENADVLYGSSETSADTVSVSFETESFSVYALSISTADYAERNDSGEPRYLIKYSNGNHYVFVVDECGNNILTGSGTVGTITLDSSSVTPAAVATQIDPLLIDSSEQYAFKEGRAGNTFAESVFIERLSYSSGTWKYSPLVTGDGWGNTYSREGSMSGDAMYFLVYSGGAAVPETPASLDNVSGAIVSTADETVYAMLTNTCGSTDLSAVSVSVSEDGVVSSADGTAVTSWTFHKISEDGIYTITTEDGSTKYLSYTVLDSGYHSLSLVDNDDGASTRFKILDNGDGTISIYDAAGKVEIYKRTDNNGISGFAVKSAALVPATGLSVKTAVEESEAPEDPYGLDDMTYALVIPNSSSSEKNVALLADVASNTSRRKAEKDSLVTVGEKTFAKQGTTEWTFKYIESKTPGDTTYYYYYISTKDADENVKYLQISSSGVTLSDSPFEVRVIKNTDTGLIRLTAESDTETAAAVNLFEGKSASGFGSWSGTGDSNEWFKLYEVYSVPAHDPPYTITYLTDRTLEQVGSNYNAGSQTWTDSTPVTVVGLDGLEDRTETNSYIVKAPSLTEMQSRAAYGSKGDQLFTYHFVGWRRSDTGEIVRAGTELTDLTSDLVLTAVWSAHFEKESADGKLSIDTGHNNIATVGFYIALGMTPVYTDPSTWLDCLYSTRVIQGMEFANLGPNDGQQRLFYGQNNGEGPVDEYDSYIRANAAVGMTQEINRTNYTVQLERFPSDDEIFSRIRTWSSRITEDKKITVDGVQYEPNQITADKFEIKWFVVKTDTSDGWHIDGKLVRKPAKLAIKKTFYGDEAAIQSVINGDYKITVVRDIEESGDSGTSEGTTTAESYELNLNEKSDQNPYGYISKDGNMYTWVLENLVPGTDYTVTESGYAVENKAVSITASVTNSSQAEHNISNSTPSITAYAVRSYLVEESSENYQTVAFTNLYTKPFIMTFMKQDGETLHGLSNAEFELRLYAQESTDENGTVTRKDYFYIVTSGSNGSIEFDFSGIEDSDFHVGTFDFSLEEIGVEGYTALSEITGKVTVTETGVVSLSDVEATVEGENALVRVDENQNAIIYIQNISERTKVTVTKTWTDETNLPVTVQLLRNGTTVAGKSAELSESNQWKVVWGDLPLYVDGSPAVYTVREIWIGSPGGSGSASYSPDKDADGYLDYTVVQSNTTDEDGNVVVNLQNTKDNGQVVFTKVNANGAGLPGAEFTVYTDESCSNVAMKEDSTSQAIFVSDVNGKVTIGDLADGTYYVKETKAPSGYMLDEENAVYILEMKAHNSVLKTQEGTQVIRITNQELQVTLKFQKLAYGSSDTSKGLPEAELSLYKETDVENGEKIKDGAIPVYSWTSGESAYIPTGKFKAGTYYIFETKSPDGYYLLDKPVSVMIKEDGTVTVTGGNSKLVENADGYNSWTVIIYNSSGVELPNTGGTGTLPYTLSGCALIMAALMYYIILRRRKEVQ